MSNTNQNNSESVLWATTDHRGVATLTLNRPKVHNAFDTDLIHALIEALEGFHQKPPRVLVLTGQGKAFCAGADLHWMQQMIAADQAENEADAKRLAKMFRLLDELPCPTIARVNGHAFGGGVGLIGCCDLAIAVEGIELGLTEVRLGLVPATIAPFVVSKIGIKHARRLMLTAEKFDAKMAVAFGLITDTTPPHGLDGHIEDVIDILLAGGPSAQAQIKQLIRTLGVEHEADRIDEYTAQLIAKVRTSEEGQEGLRAFLEKRPPNWTPNPLGVDSKKDQGKS